MQKDTTIKPSIGLNQDQSIFEQPENSYRFALNSVTETELGDFTFLSNEESNVPCDNFPEDFIPIGKEYMEDGKTAVFLVKNDESVSEIGIYDENCIYTTHVNDSNSTNKLNFKVSKQIDATYRIRRGCERVVYFTDDYNKPRFYNFDKPENFKTQGVFDANKFELQKSYKSIPNFTSIEVLNSGGSIEPGSYNFSIQYLDEDLNPTEWVTTSNIVKIYNDSLTSDYKDINGSVNSELDFISFPKTNKSIKVNLNQLDSDNYLYYRIAIIASNNGSGLVNEIHYTEPIPTKKTFYIFTGNSNLEKGTENEIKTFTDYIYRAKNIEQIENSLILSNLQGKNVDYCKLQKYASKIKVDCAIKQVVLNDLSDLSSPKNPLQDIAGLGYMPGEIYSLGIVYIFEDNTLSPVYHIPGKNPDVEPDTIYASNIFDADGKQVIYPMMNRDKDKNIVNQGQSVYIENESCTNSIFWGLDSEGIPLKNTPIRHHRFPLRSEIGLPLIEKTTLDEVKSTNYQLQLEIVGDLKTPYCNVVADPKCTPEILPDFEIRITYEIESQVYSFVQNIDPNFYSGDTDSYALNISQISQYHTANNPLTDFQNITINITDKNGNYQPTETPVIINTPFTLSTDNEYFKTEATYKVSIINFESSSQGAVYIANVLGIKVSDVQMPPTKELNGNKIIGYYIVRNERTESDKTILDNGVLIPSISNQKYMSSGLLCPEISEDKVSKYQFGLIFPEHKFLNKKLTEFDKILQQGRFDVVERKKGKVNYDDVYDGSSINKSQKGGNDDGYDVDGSPTSKGYDGWSFNLITRDNIVNYSVDTETTLLKNEIKEVFYLDALENKAINNYTTEYYNISADNKIGVLSTVVPVKNPNQLKYVTLYRKNSDPYSNFRILPYYKEHQNPFYFDEDTEVFSEATVFNGDTYISSMKYLHTMFWDNRIAKRKAKTNLLKTILAPVLLVAGFLLAIGTFGAGLLVVGAGISLLGGGALLLSSGIKEANFNRAYNEEYERGLRQTTLDDWVYRFYSYIGTVFGCSRDNGCRGEDERYDGPSDDTVQWVSDAITDLWFESSININLRNKFIDDVTPTFVNSPGLVENGNNSPIQTWEFYGIFYHDSNQQRYPWSSLERHVCRKLLAFDSKRDDNRTYLGFPLGEYYNINLDYLRKNKQKVYFHIPLEYDCCSKCKEDFPNRWRWSEPSFQEELTDNYRVFLPNNYRDLDGETGEINNTFRISNNLYMHTSEALWLVPRSYQERVTDQIVSYIGSGSAYELPPRKIVEDDTGSSGGIQHKWSAIKTPYGYFYVTENQRIIYQFSGESISPISSKGLYNWFFNNIEVLTDTRYKINNNRSYPFRDNPSNHIGTGYISVYDPEKERIIFTKRDFLIPDYGSLYEVCTDGSTVKFFPSYEDILKAYNLQGWNYLGLENCRMKFEKTIEKIRKEKRYKFVNIPNDTDIIVWLDTSGSFTPTARNQIKMSVDTWLKDFKIKNPLWIGALKYIEEPEILLTTERWLLILERAKVIHYNNDLSDKKRNILGISFVNESDPFYHETFSQNTITGPGPKFQEDYDNFFTNFNIIKNLGGSFNGLNYPIIFNSNGVTLLSTMEFLKSTLAILKGVPYTDEELSKIVRNPFINNNDWDTILNCLKTDNLYPDNGLKNYNWSIITNRGWDIDNPNTPIITPEQFSEDINDYLSSFISLEEVEVDVKYLETIYEYVDGVEMPYPINKDKNGWTISYCLKKNSWLSWHSYIPNFYINTSNKFFSWIPTLNNVIWKHNNKGNYQTFYGEYYSHIIEYVSLSTPLITRIWNHIRLITEAKKYDPIDNEYYDLRFITFNKAVLYNSRQCSGVLELVVKDTQDNPFDYLHQQVVNNNLNKSIIDRTERDWLINDFRDYRINYEKSIWISNKNSNEIQKNYFIDKVLNLSSIDLNKSWEQLEKFRDKYLVIRLVFDKFADVKLITNYSVENEQQSLH